MSEAIVQYNGGEFRVINDEIWATQKDMATAFGVGTQAITKHVNNILQDGELQEVRVCSILEHTASDGKTYTVKCYSLDMIIAVGFRIKSAIGTAFRIWANGIIKQYATKGLVVNPNMSADDLEKVLGTVVAQKRQIEAQAGMLVNLRGDLKTLQGKVGAKTSQVNELVKRNERLVLRDLNNASLIKEQQAIIEEQKALLDDYRPKGEQPEGTILVHPHWRKKPTKKTASAPCQQPPATTPPPCPPTVVPHPESQVVVERNDDDMPF